MRKLLVPFALLVLLLSVPVFAEDATEAPATDIVEAVEETAPVEPAAPEEAEPAPEPVEPEEPETEEEAAETVSLLVAAFNVGAWPVVVGLIIMLVVWAVRRFALKKIDEKWKKATPWVAAGLGILSCIGVSLAAGTMVWWRALIDGFVSGISASGLWELIGKHLLGKGEDK
jgi:uncharacterized membrane protein YcjF (UPF0283 family)